MVVSLSGVGVEPQGQADAYKMKLKAEESCRHQLGYGEFGLVVVHQGNQVPGPMASPGGLPFWLRRSLGRGPPARRASQLGGRGAAQRPEGRGGPGAGHAGGTAAGLARQGQGGWRSKLGDDGDGMGWMRVHETSLMHMDKHLLGLLHASIAMNENSLHASNLKGMPALVRVASRDKAVPPWFGRRMARHLQEEGANVTFEEFDQEHWCLEAGDRWWDTRSPNDGGVVHDATLRRWTTGVAAASTEDLLEMLRRGPQVLSAGGPQYLGRFGLRILHRTAPSARGFVEAVDGSLLSGREPLPHAGHFAELICRAAKFQRAELQVAVEWDLGQLPLVRAELRREETCPSSPPVAGWRRCGAVGRAYQGPIREVFAAPWVVVIPDEPTTL
eukprot:Skav221324  [mRNA]  locus=scaffold2901:289421:297791:+ [translate_table: standard]